MDYNDIPVFIRVVETSSFTKAAESLGVQKSSVSRSLGRLESELGIRLLQRTTRRLGLTEAGQTFYERVRGALTSFDEAAATVRELGSEPRGLVRLTAPPGAAEIGLADAVATFTQQYPAVHVEIDLSARVVDLVGEGFDIAVRAGKLVDSSLIAKRIGTTDLVFLASPAYLKRRGRPRAFGDLAQHDCVLFRGRPGKQIWTAIVGDHEETVEVTGRIHTNESMFVLRAALAGAGVVALPPQLAREPILHDDLELLLPQCYVRGSDLHVLMPSSAFVPARVMLLRDHLVRELSAVAAEVHRECEKAHAGRHKSAKPAPRPPTGKLAKAR